MALDVSKLSATPDFSPLLPASKSGVAGGMSGDIISQWSLLRANGKALRAALRAEERGYLRDSEGPKAELMSDKYFPSADRSVTVKDVLAMLGVESSIPKEETPADGAAGAGEAAATGSDAQDGASTPSAGGVDVTA